MLCCLCLNGKTQHVFGIGYSAVIVAAKNDDFPQGENACPGEKEEEDYEEGEATAGFCDELVAWWLVEATWPHHTSEQSSLGS